MDLSGKVAVVTGGNGGIGLGIARGLVSAGCQVGIWARNEAKNAAAAATLERFGFIDGIFANDGIGGAGRPSFLERVERTKSGVRASWRSSSCPLCPRTPLEKSRRTC